MASVCDWGNPGKTPLEVKPKPYPRQAAFQLRDGSTRKALRPQEPAGRPSHAPACGICMKDIIREAVARAEMERQAPARFDPRAAAAATSIHNARDGDLET